MDVRILDEQFPCDCRDCECTQSTDLELSDGSHMCGCCMADCPDVHGSDGIRLRDGIFVRMVPWSRGWELHVDGVGVTQIEHGEDRAARVRGLLAAHNRSDAETVALIFDMSPEDWRRYYADD